MRRGDPSDNGRSYFRSCTRIFNLNGAWYFNTREEPQGPFARKEIAALEMARYIEGRRELRRFQKSRESVTNIHAEDLTLAILPIEEPAVNENVGLENTRRLLRANFRLHSV